MSSTAWSDLSGLSEALVALVSKTTAGLVAIKAAPYRTVSGVALKNDLVAVTDHTLRREEKISVYTADGREASATILGRDPSVDLALLKVNGNDLQPLAGADSASLKAGNLAAVVGLTLDVGPSASLGILGAVGPSRRTWRGGTLDQFIRLDASVYPSQSGAAVVDAEGRLIGMASQGLLRHSAVAVPLATIERVAKELIEQGRIRHGYLGVGVQGVAVPASLRGKLPKPYESGLILLTVEADSPAERAAMQVGDILLSLNNKAVTDIEELQSALRGDAVGSRVKALVLRGGEPAEIEVTIAERGKRNS